MRSRTKRIWADLVLHVATTGSTSWAHFLIVWVLILLLAAGAFKLLTLTGVDNETAFNQWAGLASGLLLLRVVYRVTWRVQKSRKRPE